MLKKYLLGFISIVASGLFIFKGLVVLDPDFGWHYKMGEFILKNGIPTHDPFSYTMPSYPVIDSEWLINILMFWGYNILGIRGLAVIFSLIATAAFVISIPRKVSLWAILPFIALSLPIFFSTAGIRPQVISWFFMAILLRIFLNSALFKKWRYFLPFLFLVWANLHGGFAAGLVVFALVIAVKIMEVKKLDLSNLLILTFSILATFINPYGPRLWVEIWNTVSSSQLHLTIREWAPALYFFDTPYLILLTFSAWLVFWDRKEINKVQLAIFLLFLFAGLSSVRNIPFWMMVNFYLIPQILVKLYSAVGKIKFARQRFWLVYKTSFLLICLILVFKSHDLIKSSLDLQEDSFYPKGAVSYFTKNPPIGRIFASYGWGGYLIWKLPSQKVFIDGRMAIWQRSEALAGESTNAYKEFLELDSGQNVMPILQKYHIKYPPQP